MTDTTRHAALDDVLATPSETEPPASAQTSALADVTAPSYKDLADMPLNFDDDAPTPGAGALDVLDDVAGDPIDFNDAVEGAREVRRKAANILNQRIKKA